MARLPRRLDYEGATHHVYGRGNGKRPIFHDSDDYRCFLRRLQKLKAELDFTVYAYCLMTNHYHLVMKTGPTNLSRVMHRMLTAYSRMFNDRWALVGHPFQGRFSNRLALSDGDLMGLVRYVHVNPVEAAMVDSPERWPWSSHRDLVRGSSEIVDASFVLGLFGGTAQYEEFMKQPVETALARSLEELADGFGGAARLRRRTCDGADRQARIAFIQAGVEAGYTLTELAKFLGRSKSAVSMLLSGAGIELSGLTPKFR